MCFTVFLLWVTVQHTHISMWVFIYKQVKRCYVRSILLIVNLSSCTIFKINKNYSWSHFSIESDCYNLTLCTESFSNYFCEKYVCERNSYSIKWVEMCELYFSQDTTSMCDLTMILVFAIEHHFGTYFLGNLSHHESFDKKSLKWLRRFLMDIFFTFYQKMLIRDIWWVSVRFHKVKKLYLKS